MTTLINWLMQVYSVTSFGVRTMGQRKGSSLAAIAGIAGVVAVLVAALATAQGFKSVMTKAATPEGVIITRTGSDSEMMSVLTGKETRIISNAAGLAQGEHGPLVSAELFVVINLPFLSTGTDANVPFRGVQPSAPEVRGNFEIVEGRMVQWGENEIVAGVGAKAQFAGLHLGNSILVGPDLWKVVGIFTAGGGFAESEIWTDAVVLQGAYRRGNTFQAVHAQLVSEDSYKAFKDSLTTDPRLNVKVVRELDYYAEQSQTLTTMIETVGYLITALMAIGALFGALNTMYSVVSARTREVATLRALGFQAGPVVVSIMVESLLLALVGGVIGGGAMHLLLNGFRTGTMNWQTFSQITFALEVSPALLLTGVIVASLIGLLGGLFPAIRAARLPIATALREL